MNSDIRRQDYIDAPETAGPQSGERVMAIFSLAVFATAQWWAILHWGGMALGFAGDAEWLAPALSAIFVLLLLGLSSIAFVGAKEQA